MADDPPREGGGLSLRFVFVACCLVAATTAGMLVASASTGDIAGSPIDDVLPGDSAAIEDERQDGAGGGLGALDPGSTTGVGGAVGFDGDTFGSTSTEIHFTAESPRPTYWRTGTYGEYTGTGWKRTTGTESYEEPIEYPGQTDGRVDYSVTLERPATAVPTPYRPTAVDIDDVLVGTDGSIVAGDRLDPGTTYSGVSRTPVDDPTLLRAAGDDHPDAVDRYTELPEQTEIALSGLARQITADADTNYDRALAVQSWLREEKSYSLEVNETGENIAETFVSEMRSGYCEYFATAMSTLLRTQDIPTRYVVGYSSGQPAGEDTYQVRAMNAHAWVEVYFEGLGWVKFDPTPGEQRLETQQEALEEVGQGYEVVEPGGPNETFEPAESTDPNPPGIDPGPGHDTDPEGYALELNRTPTPGAQLEVRVLKDGQPATFVEVLFDGEPIGRSPTFGPPLGAGTATGTVPARNGTFEISVRQIPRDAIQPVGDEPPDIVLQSNGEIEEGSTPAPSTNASNRILYRETVRIVTDADVRATGELLPGSGATVTALVDGQPLSNATVSVDGKRLDARTDANGRATVELPERPGNVTIGVIDGQVSGRTVVSLPEPEVTVTPSAPVALPFTTATVEVRYGDETAIGVPVERDGQRVGTTGVDGEATVRLPLAPSETYTVGEGELSRTVTVEGLLINALFLLALPAGLLLALATVLVRHGFGPLAGGAARLVSLPRRAGESLRRTVLALAGLPSMLARGGRELWSVLTGNGGDDGGQNGSSASATAGSGLPMAPPDEQLSSGRAAVRTAWRRFGAHVSAPATGRTPEELARYAVECDGLPPAQVWTLLDAFRAVEYGGQSADRHCGRAETALENIETAGTVTEETESGPDGSGLVGDGGSARRRDDAGAGRAERGDGGETGCRPDEEDEDARRRGGPGR